MRLNYFRRIFKVYLTREKGYLNFWHETPAVADGILAEELGPYYMTFRDKANYTGPKDKDGVILFDYYFDIGRQYNPLAVTQYGLGHFNLYLETKNESHLEIAKIQAEWLIRNLELNDKGLYVWPHKFRWHYKQNLESGWFSAHSQGTGISLLARLYRETGERKYLECAEKAFASLNTEIANGGVKYIGDNGVWLEEYLISPPTHILNGFLWALWGVWDYFLLTRNLDAKELFNACAKTLKENIKRYDAGFWSLYDLSKQSLKMIASPFYHKLHVVQLKATGIITKQEIFTSYAEKFERYEKNNFFRIRALIQKAVFKILYF